MTLGQMGGRVIDKGRGLPQDIVDMVRMIDIYASATYVPRPPPHAIALVQYHDGRQFLPLAASMGMIEQGLPISADWPNNSPIRRTSASERGWRDRRILTVGSGETLIVYSPICQATVYKFGSSLPDRAFLTMILPEQYSRRRLTAEKPFIGDIFRGVHYLGHRLYMALGGHV
jgi:hypothetical protein